MSNSYQRELDVALDAVRMACAVCRSVQSTITPDVLEKKDKSPVTVADFASQSVICRALAAAFPDHPVIGEEDAAELRVDGGADFLGRVRHELHQVGIDADGASICDWIDHGSTKAYSDRFWTLDPIDGTKGFLRKEQYAVSLALIVNGQIDLAILGCPNLPVTPGDDANAGVLCVAIRGQGSRIIPLAGADNDAVSSHVTENTNANAARFCESVESGHSSHDDSAKVAELLGITRDGVRLDSQAKYAVVGRGEADIYMRLPTRPGYREKIWDHAGGVLFVEEAGGMVTDVDGRPLDFTRGFELTENRGVIVTNRKLHAQVIKALADVGVGQSNRTA